MVLLESIGIIIGISVVVGLIIISLAKFVFKDKEMVSYHWEINGSHEKTLGDYIFWLEMEEDLVLDMLIVIEWEYTSSSEVKNAHAHNMEHYILSLEPVYRRATSAILIFKKK